MAKWWILWLSIKDFKQNTFGAPASDKNTLVIHTYIFQERRLSYEETEEVKRSIHHEFVRDNAAIQVQATFIHSKVHIFRGLTNAEGCPKNLNLLSTVPTLVWFLINTK